MPDDEGETELLNIHETINLYEKLETIGFRDLERTLSNVNFESFDEEIFPLESSEILSLFGNGSLMSEEEIAGLSSDAVAWIRGIIAAKDKKERDAADRAMRLEMYANGQLPENYEEDPVDLMGLTGKLSRVLWTRYDVTNIRELVAFYKSCAPFENQIFLSFEQREKITAVLKRFGLVE